MLHAYEVDVDPNQKMLSQGIEHTRIDLSVNITLLQSWLMFSCAKSKLFSMWVFESRSFITVLLRLMPVLWSFSYIVFRDIYNKLFLASPRLSSTFFSKRGRIALTSLWDGTWLLPVVVVVVAAEFCRVDSPWPE